MGKDSGLRLIAMDQLTYIGVVIRPEERGHRTTNERSIHHRDPLGAASLDIFLSEMQELLSSALQFTAIVSNILS